ncbi:MAG: bifunctional 4-hydroxy-2-oxoglutarate aldolase/2-dehydro-3-deoxy-phosphogluconate aldolase [Firmicutes bacterium]|nr:bifunctional 4-hydroxy-2-oxoglutarate aldolase/2-dehydro-3-deoxy-phosphogluconate aldolase [Bacillota bacterium]
MNKNQVMQAIEDTGIIVIIRGMEPAKMAKIANALVAGGIKALEVTMNSSQPLKMIEELKAFTVDTDAIVGAGTVLDAETARAAILSGAEFILGPNLNLDVIALANRYNKVVIPGVMTPTEMMTAWEAGADFLKIFPANNLGPGFIKNVQAPLGQVKLIPTGGINMDNASSYIEAGAVALGVGGGILDKELIIKEDYKALTNKVSNFCKTIKEAREKNSCC